MRLLRFVLTGIYLVLVSLITLWPALQGAGSPGFVDRIFVWFSSLGFVVSFDFFEKFTNVLLFLPFGFLGLWFLGVSRFWFVVFAGFGVSFCIEVLQFFIPGRVSSVLDVLLNGFGGFLGALLWLLFILVCGFFSAFVERKRATRL